MNRTGRSRLWAKRTAKMHRIGLSLASAGRCTVAPQPPGMPMFLLRSMFWLSVAVMAMPPAADGTTPPPRVGLVEAALAARVLVQDIAGVCAREPDACATSRDALDLFRRKAETGADLAGRLLSGDAEAAGEAGIGGVDRGTLTEDDLAPRWAGGRFAT